MTPDCRSFAVKAQERGAKYAMNCRHDFVIAGPRVPVDAITCLDRGHTSAGLRLPHGKGDLIVRESFFRIWALLSFRNWARPSAFSSDGFWVRTR